LSGGANTVPEPGSLLLLLMGMMALVLLRRGNTTGTRLSLIDKPQATSDSEVA